MPSNPVLSLPVLSLLVGALLGAALPASGQELPEGPGKELVAAQCNSCHTLTSRVGAGYTAAGWRTVMRMMINNGVPIPPDQLATMTAYLVKTFPEKPKPVGVVIPGPVKVSFKEWPVPTPGSRPHDPLATADGALWYTGQMANVLGRLDPKTGRFKEYPLPTPHGGPHGLVADQAGNIWYTANAGGLIGKLEPKTGAVTEYKMPDPVVHRPERQPGGAAQSEDGRDHAGDSANAEVAALRDGGELEGRGVLRGLREQPGGERRSDDDGDPRVSVAGCGLASAADHGHSRRRRLVHGLLARLSGPARPRDRSGDRVALTERTQVRALRYLGDRRRHLVQRVRSNAEHGGAVRSEDREVPELGDPGGRQHRAQHLGHPRG